MTNLALLAQTVHQIWYAIPLIVSISLVYAATRHEYMVPILAHALRFGLWICVFMAAVMGVLTIFNWMVT